MRERGTLSDYRWESNLCGIAGEQCFDVLVRTPVVNPLGASVNHVAEHMCKCLLPCGHSLEVRARSLTVTQCAVACNDITACSTPRVFRNIEKPHERADWRTHLRGESQRSGCSEVLWLLAD